MPPLDAFAALAVAGGVADVGSGFCAGAAVTAAGALGGVAANASAVRLLAAWCAAAGVYYKC